MGGCAPITTDAIITLVPYDVGPGIAYTPGHSVPPVPIDSGSLTDDSDGTGFTLACKEDPGGGDINYWSGVVATYFRTPPGFIPAAIAIQLRAKTNDSSIVSHGYRLEASFTSVDNSIYFTHDDIGVPSAAIVGGDWVPVRVPSGSFDALLNAVTSTLAPPYTGVAEPDCFLGYWENVPFDIDNPTDSGGWYEMGYAHDALVEGDIEALMGDGLCLHLDIYPFGGVSLAEQGVWFDVVDLYEVRLVVSGAVDVGTLKVWSEVDHEWLWQGEGSVSGETGVGRFKVWDGSDWRIAEPVPGEGGVGRLKVWDGAGWRTTLPIGGP